MDSSLSEARLNTSLAQRQCVVGGYFGVCRDLGTDRQSDGHTLGLFRVEAREIGGPKPQRLLSLSERGLVSRAREKQGPGRSSTVPPIV